MKPPRLRHVTIQFEAVIELDDDRDYLQARSLAQYIEREINARSINHAQGESFTVTDVKVTDLPHEDKLRFKR